VICDTCNGVGYLADANPAQPCPACNGVGVTYCCEGERAGGVEVSLHPVVAQVTEQHIHASGTSPDHIASVNCWCRPERIEDGVYLHADGDRRLLDETVTL
jgi:hypothetical protein